MYADNFRFEVDHDSASPLDGKDMDEIARNILIVKKLVKNYDLKQDANKRSQDGEVIGDETADRPPAGDQILFTCIAVLLTTISTCLPQCPIFSTFDLNHLPRSPPPIVA
jgi:hypothetical protein